MCRMLTAILLGALVASGCTTAADEPATQGGSSTANAPSVDGESSAQDEPSALGEPAPREPIRPENIDCEPREFYWDVFGCQPANSIPLNELHWGGMGPDVIPPIDEPRFESIEAADSWLTDTSPIMVVEAGNEVRGYPLAILTQHEIVNDVVDGVPVVVTYCPLCNSALVFERTVDGPDGPEVLDFGTSGRLFRSNLVMYDRQYKNLWLQFEGEAVVGEPHLGTQLPRLPAWLFGFGEFAELHPEAQVLSRDTSHDREYGRNSYVAYDHEDAQPFLYDGEVDPRFPPMTRLIGVSRRGESAAIPLQRLVERRAIDFNLNGEAIVVVWAPGQASALDARTVDGGRDIGQTAVFIAELNDQRIELEPTETDGTFRDRHTGSVFDLAGRVIDGPLGGQRLRALAHDDTFWFTWQAFRPDSIVVD